MRNGFGCDGFGCKNADMGSEVGKRIAYFYLPRLAEARPPRLLDAVGILPEVAEALVIFVLVRPH